ATTTSETIDSTGATLALFNNVTFGSSTSISNWSLTTALDIDGDLAVNEGVLSRGLSEISVAGDLSTGLNGSWTGVGTTTFDGNGTSNWSDAHLTPENVGKVVIDGSSKTISLAGNVAAESVSIGADDILSASASDYDITVYQDWINNNTFLAQQGTVFFGATSTNKTIIAGGDSFYDLTFNGVGGAWSFSEANLSVTNNFTVSTGTVTMPTGTTTLSGSFSSVGGTFSHNNATLLMTSGGVETLAASGTPFTNAFYNLTFNGSGSWTFTDTNATTSNDFRIQSGTATFPSGELSIGGSLVETGGGFNHGNGTVKFISAAQGNLVDPDNSSFNNLTFDGPNGGWSLPASNNMTVLGDFTIASGTATSTSGTLFVGGSWNITAGVGGGTSAAPGDYLIRRNDSDTASVTTANLNAGWDTAVASNGSSISYSAPTSTLAAGKYLVMYSERFDTTDITNNQRVEIQSRLLIDGLATTTGAGQTYVRKEDGSAGDWQRAAIVGGSAIINISNDDTELATRFYRTDSSSDGGGTTDRTPGWGGMTILRLDDSWNYARYNVSGETATVDTFNEVVWDQTAEEDTGFSRTGANITITNAGRYLVTYTIPITTDGGSDRTEYISKIQLDNTDVEGSYVSTYIRENQSTDDGVLSYVGIINVSASDVLDIKMDMTDGTITGHNMEEGSSIEILELPSGNETIIAEATTGEMNPVTLTEFAWDTTAFIDTDAFTMGAGTDSYVDVDVDGDYLFFAAQQTTNGGTRTFPSARFSVNDVISSSTSGGQFNRSGGADQGGFAFGGLLTNLSAGDDISLENIYIEVDRAAQTLNHGAMSGLRLGSVFSAPASEGSTGGTFIANGGLVEFDSSDSGETINPGNSHFYDVVFDNASGGWTLSTDATSTNNFILTNVSDFTNTQTVEVQGEFSTAVASTSTTWTGGVLYLNSETDYEINNKLTGGDDYGTLQVGANTDISMWNSSSTVYAVDASSSLYSQDHYATDGYLNIFGDYNRTSGTEYWSYATDFDGTDLSGGSERQTNVYIENSSVVTITDTFLEGIGTSTASTTVQNRGSGTYTVNISGGTTTL
ncbi:MAG: hypothetical protein DRQ39_09630, partial [Gammaproteobacteria bacterium]